MEFTELKFGRVKLNRSIGPCGERTVRKNISKLMIKVCDQVIANCMLGSFRSVSPTADAYRRSHKRFLGEF